MPEPHTDKGAALVYCRVSTKALAEGTSLDSQSARCVAHAESLGYTVARVTLEVHSGADLFGRPLLARDRADVRAGRYQALVAYSVDRLTRDEAHLAIIRAECDRAGCRLVFADGGAEGPLSREAYAAKAERRNVVERMKRGRHAKLMQGRPTFNGWTLYGYRPDRDAGVYQIYEPEAVIVRRVFSLCAEGLGTYRIASAFNREGIPTPKRRHRPGSRWTSATVSLILSNRAYTGEEVCWKVRKGGGRRERQRPESEWVRLPEGVRPAIVTPELWEECRRKVEARVPRMNDGVKHPALLRGHIFCAECGAGMVRNYFRRGKYEYLKYRCGSRWRPFATRCRGEAVPLEAAHGWAWGVVERLLLHPDTAARAAMHALPASSAELEAARLAHESAALALRALLAADAGDALGPYLEQATREERALGRLVAELEERQDKVARPAGDLLRLCERARQGVGNLTFDERRLALKALGFKMFANGDDPTRWCHEQSIL